MILLALDTCDSRGSLAVLRDEEVLSAFSHEGTLDYSSWVLPAAEEALRASHLSMEAVDVFAAAAGPGSFTGVRVGLTTVKAWSEAYGKPIASVSRLVAMASQIIGSSGYVAAFVDAQRDQVFGGLYRRESAALSLVEQEMVIEPASFLEWVTQRGGEGPVSWTSLDPEKITALAGWREHGEKGEKIETSASMLAPVIGRVGHKKALSGQVVDALGLDAEYVRRSDAEIFWKGARASRES